MCVIDTVNDLINQSTDIDALPIMLEAQALLATTDTLQESVTTVMYGKKGVAASWKKRLILILTKNFRVKAFFQTYKGSNLHHVVFLGFKDDVEVAAMLYSFAVKCIERGMYRYYRKFRDSGKISQGVRTDYADNFLDTLESKYIAQVKEHEWNFNIRVHPLVQQYYTNLKECCK